jgi:general secretion pathway protein A
VYKSFFGLKKNPFNVNPDPAYLYLTPQMSQALDELTYGLEKRKGLMLLTGEAGTGKTTLINHLLLWLGHKRAHTAFIFNSHLDRDQMFDFVLSDFEIPETPQSKANPLMVFNEWLLARYRAKDLVVLIVDEAQGLSVQVLEEIRLLLNMEMPDEKLLQIILAGQPELETKLRRPDLRQLHQRIALRCKTAPLTLEQTHGYIEDRLHTAGSKHEQVFSAEAVEAIHNHSRGIPRVVNLLCEHSLVAAYVEQQLPIGPEIVDEAARELQFDDFKPVTPRLRPVASVKVENETPDLHAILAKIRADAERAHSWGNTEKATPYLVDAPKPVIAAYNEELARPNREPVTPAIEVPGAQVARQIPAAAQVPRAAISSRPSPTYAARERTWQNAKSSHALARKSLAAARARIVRINIPAHIEKAMGTVRRWDVPRKVSAAAGRVRKQAQPQVTSFRRNAGPMLRSAFAAARSYTGLRATEARGWFLANFRTDTYGRNLSAAFGLSLTLYLIGRAINPEQGWQHPALVTLTFTAFMLSILALCLTVGILVRARQSVLRDSATFLAPALRWLRAPIYTMQMRELTSVGGKVDGQHRA